MTKCNKGCDEVQTGPVFTPSCSFSLFQPGQHRYLLVHPALRIGLRQGAHVPGKVLVSTIPISHVRAHTGRTREEGVGSDGRRGLSDSFNAVRVCVFLPTVKHEKENCGAKSRGKCAHLYLYMLHCFHPFFLTHSVVNVVLYHKRDLFNLTERVKARKGFFCFFGGILHLFKQWNWLQLWQKLLAVAPHHSPPHPVLQLDWNRSNTCQKQKERGRCFLFTSVKSKSSDIPTESWRRKKNNAHNVLCQKSSKVSFDLILVRAF